MPYNNKKLFDPLNCEPVRMIVTGVTGAIDASTNNYVYTPSIQLPEVKEVIFAPPATIVYWMDGSRTIVKCSDDDYFNEEVGFALCFVKKILSAGGYKKNMNTYIRNNIKNAKRYWRPIPLTKNLTVDIPDIIPELAKKINEVLMPQHGMDKGSL